MYVVKVCLYSMKLNAGIITDKMEEPKHFKEIEDKGTEIKIDIRDAPWGDRHFAIQDPNGVGSDLVKYSGV